MTKNPKIFGWKGGEFLTTRWDLLFKMTKAKGGVIKNES
jgi:hypothetical protein